MANLVDWIKSAANGEPIEAVAIGRVPTWTDEDYEDKAPTLLTWRKARPILDVEFNSGYGSPSCLPICAWTKSRVIFVSVYDGATGIEWLPRNPMPFNPTWIGGW